MQVKKLPIYEFLEGRNKSFIVPVYQRDYAWKLENCKKLWEDILHLRGAEKPNHFLGSLVNIYNSQEEWMIIDGQQRLTTISLLLLALANYLKIKENKTQKEGDLQEDLLDFYLINKRSRDKSKRIRLKPNKKDKEYFESLFEGKETTDDSNIIRNYNFFYDQISTALVSPAELFELFRKLEVVNIELEKNIDDPQLIFESLNSTGVDLTDGDLIRNYILMDLDQSDQEYLYNSYWIKIERLSGDVATFIRTFLMCFYQKSINKSKRSVYSEFKKYAEEEFKRNSLNILEELLKYVEIYSYLVDIRKHPDPNINEALSRLHRLDFTVSDPFLLDVLTLFNDNILSSIDVVHIIQLVESYAFRKILVYKTTQGLNKFFVTLAKEIKKEVDWQNNYFQIMSFIVKNKSASQKFPTDDEFKQTLIYKEIYKLKANNRDFLFESLENYDSSYKVDISDLTVEHIMPQKITQRWKDTLGKNFKQIHDKYLHTLGNLSLTAKNSALSNKDFQNKKEVDFESSKLTLNYKLNSVEEWNEESILERANYLARKALEIWKYPASSFVKDIEEHHIYDFSEEISFTGSKPKILWIEGTEYKVQSWRDVLTTVCRELFNQSPTDFKYMILNSEINKYFSTVESDSKLKSPLQFSKLYFVEGNQSANSIFSLCCKLCEKLDLDTTNIVVELL